MNSILLRFTGYGTAVCALLLMCAFTHNAHAQNSTKPCSAPVVTLQIWKDSSEPEQYAFLAGFVSMFELEKEWQGQKGLLPLDRSMIGSWGRGMDGMSLTGIRHAVNAYAMKNPAEGEKLVLDVLWHECAQPNLQKTTPAASIDTQKRVRRAMEHKKQ